MEDKIIRGGRCTFILILKRTCIVIIVISYTVGITNVFEIYGQ